MEPYRHEDADGDAMTISPGDGEALIVILKQLPVRVGPPDIDGITRAMHEACGQQPPVILERPDVQIPRDGSPVRFGDFGFRLYEGDIAVSLPGIVAKAITPGALRETAAFMAAYADAVEAEPDPADVDDLAAAIMRAHNPGVMGLDGARPTARTALRWMKDREARNG